MPARHLGVPRVRGGEDRALEPEPRRLGEPDLRLRDRAHLAREPDLAEHERARRERAIAEARGERGDGGEVGGGIVHREAAGDVHEQIAAEDLHPDLLLEHRREQRHAVRVDAERGAARRAEPVGATSAWISTSTVRVPFSTAVTALPGRVLRPLREEERGRVRHLGEPARLHLEDANLARRAEAVLVRAQHAVRVRATALEVEDGVDHVLEHARAGDRAVLRHVPDEEHRRLGGLRVRHEARRRPRGSA